MRVAESFYAQSVRRTARAGECMGAGVVLSLTGRVIPGGNVPEVSVAQGAAEPDRPSLRVACTETADPPPIEWNAGPVRAVSRKLPVTLFTDLEIPCSSFTSTPHPIP